MRHDGNLLPQGYEAEVWVVALVGQQTSVVEQSALPAKVVEEAGVWEDMLTPTQYYPTEVQPDWLVRCAESLQRVCHPNSNQAASQDTVFRHVS